MLSGFTFPRIVTSTKDENDRLGYGSWDNCITPLFEKIKKQEFAQILTYYRLL